MLTRFKNKSAEVNKRVRLIPKSDTSLSAENLNPNIVVEEDGALGFCLSANSDEITATYDDFYQTMTVTGGAGLVVETKDSNDNVIGSGVIGSDGSVTYPINEDNYDRSVPIFTKTSTSNVVEHNLTVSFLAEMTDSVDDHGFGTGRFNPWIMFTKEITQRNGQSNNAWDNVPFDESATGRVYVQWNWDELESIHVYTLAEIRAAFTVRYGADFYPADEFYSKENSTTAPTIKVRFDVDTPIILGLASTDTIHQFYDDGSDNKTIGYRFGLDFGGDSPLRKVPTYLPKSIKKLDFMFASGGLQMFENAEGAANLALWDVGRIVSMNSTFAETDDPVIPISTWRPVNLTSMARFISASACNGLGVSSISDWKTPLLTNINEAFMGRYTGNKYYSDLSRWCVPLITSEPAIWHDGQMIPPVWGTCPVKPEDDETPPDITANYDNSMQTMTVTGPSDLLVETTDGNGVIIGSGVIGSDGSVTYTLNTEGQVDNAPIYTKSEFSNTVSHFLVMPIDTSWDIEYVVDGAATRVKAANIYGDIPDNYIDQNTVIKSATSLTINGTVRSVGNYGFRGCTMLTNLVLPTSLQIIYGSAFKGLTSLVSLIIPEGVTDLYLEAFAGCSSLKTIIVPSTMLNMRSGCFDNCFACESITLHADTPPTLSYPIFANNEQIAIYVPASSVDAYKSANWWSNYSDRIFAIPT